MLLSSMCITYECLVIETKGLKLKFCFFYVLNREKTGSLAHLDVMENTGRMYVHFV